MNTARWSALHFRISDARQFAEELLGRIHMDQRDVVVVAETCRRQFPLPLAAADRDRRNTQVS